MSITPLIELHYLPTLEYFCLLLKHKGCIIETHEHFQRRTFRSRTPILTDKGPLLLNLSLQGGNKGSYKQHIQEILIDTKSQSTKKHWRTLQTAYSRAPFFEHYSPFFEPLFLSPPDTLFEFNHQLLTMCLRLTQIDIEISFSKDFVKASQSIQDDYRGFILPNQSFEQRSWYRPIRYNQVFGEEFIPNLSIVDLLFNAGPQSHDILYQSIEKEVS
ncbi:MAG TPA: hypothetical protein DCE41_07505 [Cytophagales bacterium]|nr:hypothetical protein [Cytophagales bacterium]HAA23034.1 hypothetical protein [Cytophagales bacterium]HAP62079.1 hypothetical protein [Cytophagales bacterium]